MDSEFDICQSYRQAKQKNKQISILAQLNTCSRTDIVKILEKNGETVPACYRRVKENKDTNMVPKDTYKEKPKDKTEGVDPFVLQNKGSRLTDEQYRVIEDELRILEYLLKQIERRSKRFKKRYEELSDQILH